MKTAIKYGTRFRKQYHKANKSVRQAFAQTLEIFLIDPYNSTLRNHALKEEYAGYRSIDVIGDVRAIFKETETRTRKVATFHFMGTHEQLYGKRKK